MSTGLYRNSLIILFTLSCFPPAQGAPKCAHIHLDESYRLTPAIPHFARSEITTGYLTDILRKWKADSPPAREWARTRGAKELEDLGLKYVPEYLPEGGFVISPYNLPKASYLSFTNFALTHPKMKQILTKMNQEGYSLLVDPTMAVKKENAVLMGSYRSYAKEIRILPKATWEVFIHEYQHLIFDKLGFRDQIYLTPIDQLPPEAQALGKKVKALNKRGMNNTAINETLAVSAEIKALYKMGYMPWSYPVYRAREYAWRHQLDGTWDPVERKKTARINSAKKILLNPTFLRTVMAATGFAILLTNRDETAVIVIDESGAQSFGIKDLSNTHPRLRH